MRFLRLYLGTALLVCSGLAVAATFNVNSITDAHDATPGDGVCATAALTCTLRAAFEEANALAGPDTVNVPAGTYTPSSTAAAGMYVAAFSITDSVSIVGASPAGTIIDGSSVIGSLTATTHCIGGMVTNGNCNIGPVIVTISALTLRNGQGSAPSGGAICNDADLTVENTWFTNNASTQYNAGIGGAVYNSSAGRLTINNSLFDGNTSFQGGAIETQGDTTISASTFHGNQSLSNGVLYGGGGAVDFAAGSFGKILASTFYQNSARRGGAIAVNSSAGPVEIVNSTISANASSEAGGAVYVSTGLAIVNVRSSTITLNRANDCTCGYQGGGIAAPNGGYSILLQNSILAQNSYTVTTAPVRILQPDECLGNVFSISALLTSHVDTGYCTVSGTHISNDAPGLAPLQDNGGPTKTHALLTGSPAIGASASNTCTDGTSQLTSDERGFSRPLAPVCDIGAFEELVFRGNFGP